ncbi:hypothetical protein ACE1CI_09970 [Aerosakkonemataceae cyanobacterium BLCC-F50]|uniref:Uncharacterized protein n=1 Tax=Floridaenema flaviceps BLCC-F50 TaxID=3153642 RepID=A0ABV4XND4_9CYAN
MRSLFRLSLEKAIALFCADGKSAIGLFLVMRSDYQKKMRSLFVKK